LDEGTESFPGSRSGFDEIRRAVMSRLRDHGFRTTGGVARLIENGNSGVIEFQKSGRSTAEAKTFTINVGIALGALIARTTKKPISHCSVAECHAYLRLGELREPASDLWWTVTGNEIDHAVLADVLDRVERDALPLIRRAIGEGALASMWRAGESVGTNAGRRVQYLRWLDAEGA
jgi:hypothetical protein